MTCNSLAAELGYKTVDEVITALFDFTPKLREGESLTSVHLCGQSSALLPHLLDETVQRHKGPSDTGR